MFLGAHISVAGGIHLACERGREVGANIIQVFVKNQRQWKASPLTDEDIRLFREAEKKYDIAVSFAHATYLLNMASADDALWRKSVDAFVLELERDTRFQMIESIETMLRSWHVTRRSVRPDHRMVAHSGFLTTAVRCEPRAGAEPPDRTAEDERELEQVIDEEHC